MKVIKGQSGPADIYFKRQDAMRDEFRRDKSHIDRYEKHKLSPVQGDPYAYDEDELLDDLEGGVPVEDIDGAEGNVDYYDDYSDFYDTEQDEFDEDRFESSAVGESWLEGGDVSGNHMTRRDRDLLQRRLRGGGISEAKRNNPINRGVRRSMAGPSEEEIQLEERTSPAQRYEEYDRALEDIYEEDRSVSRGVASNSGLTTFKNEEVIATYPVFDEQEDYEREDYDIHDEIVLVAVDRPYRPGMDNLSRKMFVVIDTDDTTSYPIYYNFSGKVAFERMWPRNVIEKFTAAITNYIEDHPEYFPESAEVGIASNSGGGDFTPHGTYTISNTMGYEVEISDDGEHARLRDPETGEIVEWLPIEYVYDEDISEDEDDFIPVIDPDGYDIPLNLVMRINSSKLGGESNQEPIMLDKNNNVKAGTEFVDTEGNPVDADGNPIESQATVLREFSGAKAESRGFDAEEYGTDLLTDPETDPGSDETIGRAKYRNLDGAGPEGMGPMTGRGMGNCPYADMSPDQVIEMDKDGSDCYGYAMYLVDNDIPVEDSVRDMLQNGVINKDTTGDFCRSFADEVPGADIGRLERAIERLEAVVSDVER